MSRARFTSSTTIFATDWKVTGTFSNGYTQLDLDGKIWTAPTDLPVRESVSGAWLNGEQWTQIRQLGDKLTLVGVYGGVTNGTLDADNLTVRSVTGQIIGTFNATQMQFNWTDGRVWTRTMFDTPLLSHVWSVDAGDLHITQIDPNGGELLLTNQQGEISRGVLRSSTQIYAVGWDTVGTLSDFDSILSWSNEASPLNAAPSDIDDLFADDFNPFD